MHILIPILAVLLTAESETRYKQELDLKKYPQDTPKHALGSFIQCIENKDIDYCLAQLADPEFVDQRVKDIGGHFEDLVKEAKRKLVYDPATLKLLKRLAEDGEWKTKDEEATLTLKDVADKPLH